MHIARKPRVPGDTTIFDREIVIGRQPRAVRARYLFTRNPVLRGFVTPPARVTPRSGWPRGSGSSQANALARSAPSFESLSFAVALGAGGALAGGIKIDPLRGSGPGVNPRPSVMGGRAGAACAFAARPHVHADTGIAEVCWGITDEARKSNKPPNYWLNARCRLS
jgi:hypothetical protein